MFEDAVTYKMLKWSAIATVLHFTIWYNILLADNPWWSANPWW